MGPERNTVLRPTKPFRSLFVGLAVAVVAIAPTLVLAPPAGAITSTATTVSASPNPVAFGSTTLLAATIRSVPDAGTVDFTYNGASIGGCASVPAGNITEVYCQTASLPAGDNTIVASFSGDANFAPSSGSVVVTVTQTVTATSTSVDAELQTTTAPDGPAITSAALSQPLQLSPPSPPCRRRVAASPSRRPAEPFAHKSR